MLETRSKNSKHSQSYQTLLSAFQGVSAKCYLPFKKWFKIILFIVQTKKITRTV